MEQGQKVLVGICVLIVLALGAKMLMKYYKDGQTLFDPTTATSTTAPDGTVTSTDANGNKKVVKPNGETTISDSNGNETFNLKNMVKKMVTDPTTYETLAAGLVYQLLWHKLGKFADESKKATEKALNKTVEKQFEKIGEKTSAKAGEKAGEKVAEKAGEKAAEKAGEKAGEKVAEKAAVKAATKAGTTAAVAASTGPGAPFVEAAEMVFQATLGLMDELNLGGFKNMTNMSELNSMRDTINKTMPESFKSVGVTWPILYGPVDKMDPKAYSAKLNKAVEEKTTQAIAAIQAGWANGTIPKPPPGSSEKEYTDAITSRLDVDKFCSDAETDICLGAGGVMKKNPTDSNMYCTWETATATTCIAPWPQTKDKDGKTSQYYELDKKNKFCAIAPTMMREKCEGLGLGVTYNMDTGSCNLTQKYCARYGADNGLKNGDCSISKGEEIAEMIFGTTFIRSLVNIFGSASYAPCPPPSHPAKEIAALVGVAAGLATVATAGGASAALAAGGGMAIGSAANMLCSQDKCNDDQDKVAGLCYPKCKKATEDEKKNGWPDYDQKSDALGSKTQGMCYRCPPKYKKSSGGLCQIMDPKTDPGVAATCPKGWKTTVVGPGGMCEPGCTEPGFTKKWGGLCYNDKVDTKLLSKTPHKAGCPPHHRDDGTSCWKETGHVGICSISCSPVYGQIDIPLWKRQTCDEGYSLKASSCWAVSRPIKVAQPMLKVGVCNDQNREKVGGMCYKKCVSPYTRLKGTGTCRVEGLPTIPADQYARKPAGISYKVFPRKRIAPFPSTSENDFKNSVLGRHIQDGINGVRNGDPGAVGKALAASAIVANPAVLVFGAGDLAEMGVQKAGLDGAKRQEGTGGE